jgi:hypothetical protein
MSKNIIFASRTRYLTELTGRYWSNGDRWHHLSVIFYVIMAEAAKGCIIALRVLDTVIKYRS